MVDIIRKPKKELTANEQAIFDQILLGFDEITGIIHKRYSGHKFMSEPKPSRGLTVSQLQPAWLGLCSRRIEYTRKWEIPYFLRDFVEYHNRYVNQPPIILDTHEKVLQATKAVQIIFPGVKTIMIPIALSAEITVGLRGKPTVISDKFGLGEIRPSSHELRGTCAIHYYERGKVSWDLISERPVARIYKDNSKVWVTSMEGDVDAMADLYDEALPLDAIQQVPRRRNVVILAGHAFYFSACTQPIISYLERFKQYGATEIKLFTFGDPMTNDMDRLCLLGDADPINRRGLPFVQFS